MPQYDGTKIQDIPAIPTTVDITQAKFLIVVPDGQHLVTYAQLVAALKQSLGK